MNGSVRRQQQEGEWKKLWVMGAGAESTFKGDTFEGDIKYVGANEYLDMDGPPSARKSGKAAENIRREHGPRTPSPTHAQSVGRPATSSWVRFSAVDGGSRISMVRRYDA